MDATRNITWNITQWCTRTLLIVDLGLAAALIALIFLIQAAGVESAPAQPAPGALLYATTFDAFNDEWDLYPGRKSAQVVGGQLQVNIGDANDGAFTWLDRRFSDFDLTVEATQLAGPDDNGYGVVFRHQDEQHYFHFLISGDGYYQVLRRNGPDLLEDVTTISGWRRSEHINLGQDAPNRLRVVARGDRFTFFVNGHPLELCLGENAIAETCQGGELTDVLIDPTFAHGHIGVAAQTFSQPGALIGFDNLVVVGPEPAPAQ